MSKAIIAIHGGAGAIARTEITDDNRQRYYDSLNEILHECQALLKAGSSALDVVTKAVTMFEDNPLFNAGRGAVLTNEQTVELDASIMNGIGLQSGSVAGVDRIKNPVLAARSVMENSRHIFFTKNGAERFAQEHGLDMVDPAYFFTERRLKELQKVQAENKDLVVLDHSGSDFNKSPLDETKKMGTVGAVALDIHGNLAAATSTGGMTNKQVGRVGDSPIIGAGCYANNKTCAVSATGTGERFIQSVAAYDISAQMEYAGRSLEEAANSVIFEKIPALKGDGGLIAIDKDGNVALPFNTEGMYRGYARVAGQPYVAIYADE